MLFAFVIVPVLMFPRFGTLMIGEKEKQNGEKEEEEV